MTQPLRGTSSPRNKSVGAWGNSLESAPKDSTNAEVHKIVGRGRRAFSHWSTLPFSERCKRLRAAAKASLRARHKIVRLAGEEVGKVPAEAMFTEALGPLDAVNAWISIVGNQIEKEVKLNPLAFPKKKAKTFLEPLGTIGVIAPWNFPAAGLYRSIIPALLLGNTVIVKPSEYSPRTSGLFLRTFASELDLDVLQIVYGAGDVGQALIGAEIDALVFTGSADTGAVVERACFERGIPCSCELGGNDAAIVFADCDKKRTVAGITQWALQNAGQACGSIEVLFLAEEIADEFSADLARAFSDLNVTSGTIANYDISALCNAAQLEIVKHHVKDAIAKGAELLAGGKKTDQGNFYLPTLLDRCTTSMLVVQEETFGPVLPIVRFRGIEEVFQSINHGQYGLTTSIWTKDIARAQRLARRLDVGVVTINNHAFTGAIPKLPWAGRKKSGRGIANSAWSLLNFSRPKTIVVDSNSNVDFFWVPLDQTLEKLGDLLSQAQLGENLLELPKIPLLMKNRIKTVRKYFGM